MNFIKHKYLICTIALEGEFLVKLHVCIYISESSRVGTLPHPLCTKLSQPYYTNWMCEGSLLSMPARRADFKSSDGQHVKSC